MLPQMYGHLENLFTNKSRQKKTEEKIKEEKKDGQIRSSLPFNKKSAEYQTRFTMRAESNKRGEDISTKKKREMSNKVSTFSDLIQRVTTSCLLNPMPETPTTFCNSDIPQDSQQQRHSLDDNDQVSDTETESEINLGFWGNKNNEMVLEREQPQIESLMFEMFEAVSDLKRAYVSLQEAHCPWDPEKMSVADMSVVAELKRLGRLRERCRRVSTSGGGGGRLGFAPLREVVAPYEAALEELKREAKAKEAEMENLREKLRCLTNGGSGKKGRVQSKRKVSCCQGQVAAAPVPELFEATMSLVKETSKSFTTLLLSLMRDARWDIAAAVRSIEAATTGDETPTSVVAPHHAKYALESYVSRKIFHGFDNETFYIDGSLSSLLNPDQFRRDCFAQFRDMKAMDPAELLGILPTCHFGKFCSKRFLAIVHPKMEESLFGNLEQHRLVLAGSHPRSQFYGEFLGFAKAVWLLHLLAFALDPSPCLFLATKDTEFHPEYMESVIKFSGGRVPLNQIVGFPVGPGFRLGNGTIIKARVYPVSRN
ncbi:hypothetical protein GIB67_007584 [Kingdonia uniflora]|uniref:DUF641 domain-containing protein n=1 Tax=Kingdonia uniflora TaxID=39325 RepID=A0A7J7N1D7_9MAGN|nr:hypothetical protein GIB67_007584 [Kingdonia uniflora]